MSKFEWSKGYALEVHVHLSKTFMNELTAVHLHRMHDFVALQFSVTLAGNVHNMKHSIT